jgi:3'-phosphoadenosine 5'-phosphosulfate sulfotransferase (PAPS reductase)/FAD synthetase
VIERAMNVLDLAGVNHKPCKFFALFSGGHDSLTAAAVAFAWGEKRQAPVEAVHINTGTGVPETTEFVKQVCGERGWPLREYHPPRSYESLVEEFGFPGPAQHGFMYQRLKERCLRQLIRESKEHRRDRVMLITGVRSQESVRRMRHVERVQLDGAKVWAAPIWDWSKLDCNRFIEKQGLPRNPVVDILHMSGECLCGSFAKPGEIKELERWYPAIADRIHALEGRIEAKGLRGYTWGQRPPKVHRGQMKLADVGPLCQDCDLGAAA